MLVDEYQDTNPLQAKLVRMMSGTDGNITAVGDDDQAIYRFRGGTVENMIDFEDDFDDPKDPAAGEHQRV